MRYLAPLSVLMLLVGSPAAGDEVFLKNGRVFEDVIAEVGPSSVRIQLAFGEMSVPLESVDRVEKGSSGLESFQARRQALQGNPGSSASEWIELARWARSEGLEHGARQAALVAADLDPGAEGLEALMRSFEFVFEAELGRWITIDESMRLRGFERVGGEWMSAEALQARALAEAEATRQRELDEERRLTRAMMALAAAQMARPEPEPEIVYAWPVAVFPNPFIVRHENPFKLPPPGYDPTAIPMGRRQPGSLFPVSGGRRASNHGGIAKAAPRSGGSH